MNQFLSTLLLVHSVLDTLVHLIHLLLNLVSSLVHVGQCFLVLSVLRHVAELCECDCACANNANACEKVLCLHCGGSLCILLLRVFEDWIEGLDRAQAIRSST